MTSLVQGYSCPACHSVLDNNACPHHPDILLDLCLDESYIPCKNGDTPWSLCRNIDNSDDADADDDDFQSNLICTMPAGRDLDAINATRIASTLTACREISTIALRAGYIQTLQQLPLLVSDYLKDPSDAAQERLRLQIVLVHSRGRSKDFDEHGDLENVDDRVDLNFDLELAQRWHKSLWLELSALLAQAGFNEKRDGEYSKRLDDQREGRVNFFELETKKTRLKIMSRSSIAHETLIEKTQVLTGHSREWCRRQSKIDCVKFDEYVFSDDSLANTKAAKKFVAAVSKNADELFQSHEDLHSICQVLAEKNCAYMTPIALAFLGHKAEALAVSEKWVADWSKYPRNRESVKQYVRDFIPGVKKIKST